MPATRPATRQDLFRRLADLQIVTRTVEHEPLFTVAESSQLERELPGAHTKNLFLKDEGGELFLVVAASGSTSRRWRGRWARAVSASASRSF
jgi:Ala-tRNA(Pro) deacylase